MKLTINFKRTLSICLAVILFVLSCIMQTNSTNAANTSVNYKVFNAQTGDYLRSYTLNPLRSENNSRNYQVDDREIDWSKNGVVKLVSGNNYVGTGFVVDKHTIATAAHLLYGSVVVPFTEILLFDSNGNVSMRATPVESHIPEAFFTNRDIDYGLITVEEDLSDYMCFNLGVISDSILPLGTNVSITGFPGMAHVNGAWKNVNTSTMHNMYTGTGALKQVNLLNGQCDIDCDVYTSGANSGSPVYITETRCGKTYNTVIAIHVSGGNEASCGKGIDTNRLHFYINNENISY